MSIKKHAHEYHHTSTTCAVLLPPTHPCGGLCPHIGLMPDRCDPGRCQPCSGGCSCWLPPQGTAPLAACVCPPAKQSSRFCVLCSEFWVLSVLWVLWITHSLSREDKWPPLPPLSPGHGEGSHAAGLSRRPLSCHHRLGREPRR